MVLRGLPAAGSVRAATRSGPGSLRRCARGGGRSGRCGQGRSNESGIPPVANLPGSNRASGEDSADGNPVRRAGARELDSEGDQGNLRDAGNAMPVEGR